jgi:probable phosphoglycerate mutase
MMERTLFLARHGQTTANRQRVFAGSTDVLLDETGRAQAAALAQHPALSSVRTVYASHLRRAHDTAAARGAPVRVVPELAEMHQGVLEGVPLADALRDHGALVKAWVDDPVGVRIPGAETLDEVGQRAIAALTRIAWHAPPGDVLVVSHQLTLAAVSCIVVGAPLSRWRDHSLANCGSVRLQFCRGSWLLTPADGSGGT